MRRLFDRFDTHRGLAAILLDRALLRRVLHNIAHGLRQLRSVASHGSTGATVCDSVVYGLLEHAVDDLEGGRLSLAANARFRSVHVRIGVAQLD